MRRERKTVTYETYQEEISAQGDSFLLDLRDAVPDGHDNVIVNDDEPLNIPAILAQQAARIRSKIYHEC